MIMQLQRGFFIAVSLFFSAAILAGGENRGERLHAEHCMSCHDTSVYTRENPIVDSFPALKTRIRQCELSNELAWFDEEIEAVANYLNDNFYHFEIEK